MDSSASASWYIDTTASLGRLCERLRGAQWLALDTEFIRERTYYPRLCLIQIATPELVACVDPLAELELKPLIERLYDPAITKVLHAAQQDIEIFYHLFGEVPSPLFDTQIAATVLGQGDQISYAALVQAVTGMNLDKSQVRTDWSRRPLSPEQTRYAADDVRFLCDVYQIQQRELAERQRLDWLQEDFQQLSDPAQYQPNPEQAWRRIKGHGKLKSSQLVVLRALAAWREQQAMHLDKPRRWVCDDTVLLDLARLQPKNDAGLAKLRGRNDKFRKRQGAELIALINEARQTPRESWPKPVQYTPLSMPQDALLDVLMGIVKVCALENDVSPLSLAGRKDLERIIQGDDAPLLHGWRKRLAGEPVLDFIKGRTSLSVDPAGLRLG